MCPFFTEFWRKNLWDGTKIPCQTIKSWAFYLSNETLIRFRPRISKKNWILSLIFRLISNLFLNFLLVSSKPSVLFLHQNWNLIRSFQWSIRVLWFCRWSIHGGSTTATKVWRFSQCFVFDWTPKVARPSVSNQYLLYGRKTTKNPREAEYLALKVCFLTKFSVFIWFSYIQFQFANLSRYWKISYRKVMQNLAKILPRCW